MEKKFMLRPNHPTVEKMNKLMRYADELGLSLEYSSYNCEVTDTKTGERYNMEDLDTSEPVTSFPSFVEFKLTFYKNVSENPHVDG